SLTSMPTWPKTSGDLAPSGFFVFLGAPGRDFHGGSRPSPQTFERGLYGVGSAHHSGRVALGRGAHVGSQPQLGLRSQRPLGGAAPGRRGVFAPRVLAAWVLMGPVHLRPNLGPGRPGKPCPGTAACWIFSPARCQALALHRLAQRRSVFEEVIMKRSMT